MHTKPFLHMLITLAMFIGVTSAVMSVRASTAHAQAVVSDPSNLVQNTTSAISEVQAVINQGLMLKNQVESIQNQLKTLEQLDVNNLQELSDALGQVNTLLYTSQGVANNWEAMGRNFDKIYVRYAGDEYNPNDYSDKKKQWAQATDEALQNSIEAHGKIAQAKNSLNASTKTLSMQNESAQGVVEAIQITNKNLEVLMKQQALLMELIINDSHSKETLQLEKRRKDQATKERKKEILGKGMADEEEIAPVTLPSL